MEKIEKDTKVKGLGRRAFLKLAGASLFCSYFLSNVKNAFGYMNTPWEITGFKNYWKDGPSGKYFVQNTVNTSQVDQGYVWGRVEGWWRRYQIQQVEEKFLNWWISDVTLEKGEGWPMMVGGAILPIVATYGNRRGRGDSQFHINCACKGIAFPPKKQYIKEIIDELKTRISLSKEERDEWWHAAAKDTSLWDYSKLTSIEIFAGPEFETHTFLNQMENPVSNISYMGRTGFDHFEVRCIVKLLCCNDPNLTEEERDLAEFANWFHIFPFGAVTYPTDLIAPVYYIIEEFDNFPYTQDGIRLVPPFEYETANKNTIPQKMEYPPFG